jgi:DNA-binding PadR family transcriptional regulator
VRTPRTELNLTEWVVLALAAEGPTHGWAVVRLVGRGGPLGEAWSASRPLVYRAIARLLADGLLRSAGPAEGHGPNRETLEITTAGAAAVTRWLGAPVDHVRDLRTAFLVKLLLLERRGEDRGPLIERQRQQLEPIAARLAVQAADAAGPDRVVALWRVTNIDAAMRFLDALGGTPDEATGALDDRRGASRDPLSPR